MTKKQLLRALEKFPDDTPVIVFNAETRLYDPVASAVALTNMMPVGDGRFLNRRANESEKGDTVIILDVPNWKA